MSEQNKFRSCRAARLLEYYADLAGEIGESPDVLITDVLADLQHLAARERIDFDQVLQMARMHFEAEQ
jgi:hypothetical protein